MGGVEPRAAGEHGAREVGRGADARAAVAHAFAPLLRPVDELLQRARRHVLRRDGEDVRELPMHGDGDDVPLGVVGQARVEVLVDGPAADRDRPHGVAVRRRLGDRVGADVAARPGPVLHHEGLPEALGQALRQQPRQDVGGPAWRPRHHHAHRPLGPSALCKGRDGRGDGRGGSGKQRAPMQHGVLPRQAPGGETPVVRNGWGSAERAEAAQREGGRGRGDDSCVAVVPLAGGGFAAGRRGNRGRPASMDGTGHTRRPRRPARGHP